MTAAYLLERAWVDGAVHEDVRVTIDAGVFVEVLVSPVHRGNARSSATETPEKRRFPRRTGETVTRIPGLTVPGLANTHSHAFHRALRGRTQRERGTFWTWREQMYAVAERLDPDSCFALARATYREMAAAGITCVGEFHYLHHQPDGTPYDEPTVMGDALVAAAQEAGIRITLLDTLYLSSGFGAPPEGVQRRYSDGSVRAWLERNHARPGATAQAAHVVLGSAVHSVRAVGRDDLAELGEQV
ncbi:amidohydrolase family protein, partial [Nocardioides sp.]|uniref:amidohydrolase family protein n=1 Tax=Nocardioides sp. TaxID=35761 RepID=UPI0027362623